MKKNLKRLIVVIVIAVAGYFGYDLILTPQTGDTPEQNDSLIVE